MREVSFTYQGQDFDAGEYSKESNFLVLVIQKGFGQEKFSDGCQPRPFWRLRFHFVRSQNLDEVPKSSNQVVLRAMRL